MTISRFFMQLCTGFTLLTFVSVQTFAAAAGTSSSSSSSVDCSALTSSMTGSTGQMASSLCYRIQSDAAMQGMSLQDYAQQVKDNPALLQQYKDFATSAAQQKMASSSATAMVAGASNNQAMCQGLCAGADAAMAIPIIGWIIAAGLIAGAISQGCDNCGGFDPV